MSQDLELEELVRQAQAGDQQAFTELYNRTHERLERVCFTVLKNPEDVKDAMQNTFIIIYRAFSGQGRAPLRDPSRFMPWAEKIARNTSVTLLDHKMRKTGHDDFRPDTSDEENIGMDVLESRSDDSDVSPDQTVENMVRRDMIETAMSSLAPDRAQCLALHEQGYTYQEISKQLSIPIGTVRSHIHYGKEQMKDAIRKVEKKYGVKIHGFAIGMTSSGTIFPKFEIRGLDKNAGWIQASVDADSPTEGAGSSAQPGAAKAVKISPKMALIRKIIAVTLTAVIIAAGIIAAVHYSRKAVNTRPTRQETTTVTERVSTTGGSPVRQTTQQRQTSARRNNNAAVNQAAAPVAQQRTQATTAPTTTETTTRPWQQNGF